MSCGYSCSVRSAGPCFLARVPVSFVRINDRVTPAMKIPLKWLRETTSLRRPAGGRAGPPADAGRPGGRRRPLARPAAARRACASRPRTPAPSGTATRSSSPQVAQRREASQRRQAQAADRRLRRRRSRRSSSPARRTSTSATRARRSSSAWPAPCYFDGHATPKKLKRAEADARSAACRATRWSVRRSNWASPTSTKASSSCEDDAPVGMPLADFMGDIVLEIDVLPNMARCLSMIGVAREVAALTGTDAEAAAARRAGRRASRSRARSRSRSRTRSCRPATPRRCIEDVKIGPAPGLDAAPARPTPACGRSTTSSTSPTTSCSNGASRCTPSTTTCSCKRAGGKAPTIIVRPARAGEMLMTLDGVRAQADARQRSSSPTTPGPIALAGVMGGAGDRGHRRRRRTSCSNRPTSTSSAFAARCRRFNLPSEASVRFSRASTRRLVRPPPSAPPS